MLRLRTTLLLVCAAMLSSSMRDGQALPSAIRWSVPIPARPAAPPAIDGDRILVVLQSGVVSSHDVSDGVEAWHVDLRADQPAAAEGSRVFVAAGEMIHALDAASGTSVWRAPAGVVTAAMIAQDGWLVAASAGSLSTFRTTDGSKVWSRDLGSPPLDATIEGDNLYVSLEDGRLAALDLRTGSERWVRHFAGAASDVLAFPDRVYAGSADKFFYCLDADDGETEWRSRIGAVLRGRPAADGARVFVTAVDNVTRAFDRVNGELRWHASVPFRPSGPVVVGSLVVVPGNGAEVRAFEAARGRPAGQITFDEALVTPPAFGSVGGVVVMAAFTGSLNGEWKLVLSGPPAAPPQAPHE